MLSESAKPAGLRRRFGARGGVDRVLLAIGGIAVAINVAVLWFGPRFKRPKTEPHLSKVVFKEKTHDFGAVLTGSRLPWQFRYANDGETTVSVVDVNSSCGCLVAYNVDQRIEPGSTGEINLTLSTSGSQPHKVQRNVTVHFDDGSTSILEVMADVRPPLSVQPATLRVKRPTSFGRSMVELSAVRDMLPPKEFLAVELKAPSYVTRVIKSRESDRIRWSLSFDHDLAPAQPPLLELQFPLRGIVDRIVVPVIYTEGSVIAVPAGYFSAIRRGLKAPELHKATRRTIQLVSNPMRHLKIESVLPQTKAARSYVDWEQCGPVNGHPAIGIWINEAPVDTLWSSTMIVSYRDVDSGVEGRLAVDARVMVSSE
jgi:hypothetical protein